jgi:hypothetical protein
VGRPFVTPKVLPNVLTTVGAVCVFVFLQPWYESKYFGGDVGRQLTNARFGLPTSPWLTYKSDSKGDENADSGLEFIARSWSWPFFAAGAALICLGSRIARRPNQADIKTDVPAAPAGPAD